MNYDIQITDSLLRHISSIPEKIRKKLSRESNRLRSNPGTSVSPIKKLNGWKNLYRLRLNEYRAVYHVDEKSKTVTLLLIEHRSKVYDLLGHDPDKNQPTSRIIADEQAQKLLEHIPSQEEFAKAYEQTLNEQPSVNSEDTDSAPLPSEFNDELLDSLNIPLNYRQTLLNCKTREELLFCGIPDKVLEKIIDSLWPPRIEEVANAPKRELRSVEALEELAEGSRPLESFLLVLDETQKPLANRFKTDDVKGPWIVKGGPGSGKSTVVLHCIMNLLWNHRSQFDFERRPLRILLTTYTKSLVRASQQLIGFMGGEKFRNQVEIVHVDELVKKHLPSNWTLRPIFYSSRNTEINNLLSNAIRICQTKDKSFPFDENDKEFLFEEVDDLIGGNEILDAEQYASFERIGMGRRLGRNQRKHVWSFWEVFQKELTSKNLCTRSQRFAVALKNSKPIYDYVFIDEAQDILPIALRMCLKLVSNSKNVFVTADRNQSIYNSGFSWKRIQEDLDFRGRSTIFQCNYRTTREIMDAIHHILDTDKQIDDETLNEQHVLQGEMPDLSYTSEEQEPEILKEWIPRSLLEERVGLGCAAILCPTNAYCEKIADVLPSKFNAVAMKPAEVDLTHRGIKVMTMHAAKGLQFPVVAVVGLKRNEMPWKVRSGSDEDQSESDQKLRRTFFVACSRAMRRLLVVGNQSQPSPFLEGFDEENWNVLSEL